MKKNYEQPTLTCVRVASTDILLTSGGDTPVVLRGGLDESFSGAKGELNFDAVWN